MSKVKRQLDVIASKLNDALRNRGYVGSAEVNGKIMNVFRLIQMLETEYIQEKLVEFKIKQIGEISKTKERPYIVNSGPDHC